MKKSLLIFLSGLSLALVLIQCSRREMEPALAASVDAGQPFELFARTSDTRTVNDGLSTLWAEGDVIGVFHAVSGTTDYQSDGQFTIDEPSTGHAAGTVRELPEGTYDWFVQYPFSGASTPATSALSFGPATGALQQAGYGSTAHLAGEAFPLFGAVRGVAGTAVPSLTVQPLAAAVAVTVTNTLDKYIRITSVTLTAPELVSGPFQVDLTAGDPVYTAEESASADATVQVVGGTSLAQNETAVIYLGCKPFTAPAGSQLTLSVTATSPSGVSATHSKTVTLPAETAFRAGYIRKLSFGFAGEFDEPETGGFIFRKVSSIVSGNRYIFVAPSEESYYRAVPFTPGEASSMMSAVEVDVASDVISVPSLDESFVFWDASGTYTIRDNAGNYLSHNNANAFYLSASPANNYQWKISFNNSGQCSAAAGNLRIKFRTEDLVFGAFKASQSGTVYPFLYEYQNQSEFEEEFLQKSAYGTYNIPDWIYAEGTMQLSVYRLGGSTSFRLFQPTDKIVTQISGIPSALALDDQFTVHVSRYENGRTKMDKDFEVKAIRIESNKAWLLSPTGAGFIVMYK